VSASAVEIAVDQPAKRLHCRAEVVEIGSSGDKPSGHSEGRLTTWRASLRQIKLSRYTKSHPQKFFCMAFFNSSKEFYMSMTPTMRNTGTELQMQVASLGMDWELHVQVLKRKGGRQDDIIVLPSIPGTLARVLAPRLLRPSQLISRTEASHANALGSAVDRRRHRQLASH